MHTHLECIPCIIRQTMSTLNLATNDKEVQKKALSEVLLYLANLDYSLAPPQHGKHIYQIIHRVSGNYDPYARLKNAYNQAVLDMYEQIKRTVRQSANPLQSAAKLAAAGNIIDFGPSDNTPRIEAIIKELQEEWGIDDSARFAGELTSAENVLYFADNAGEIVFDRLFIETMHELFPRNKLKFTVVVRGAAVINDATMEDARQAGVTEVARVIANGDTTPGTVLSAVSEEVRQLMEQADLVIAKGMGNFETLTDVQRTIYFLLRIKCRPVAGLAGAGVGKLVFAAGAGREQA